MKLQIIATRDVVANVYGIPMFVPHIGHAIRSFGDECRNKDPKNVLGQHPEDFELMHLGEYDDETGEFWIWNGEAQGSPMCQKKQLAVGANYRDTVAPPKLPYQENREDRYNGGRS